jgi:hypothetical protein
MPYKFSDKTPGVFKVNQLDERNNFISKKIEEIENNNNPRTIIMETWFIVDWLLRQLIISGINCLDLKSTKFHPHYDLLPNSFRECVDCLKNLISSQKILPSQVERKIKDSLRGSEELWLYIQDVSPDTFEKIGKLENEFNRKKYNIPEDKDFVMIDDITVNETGGIKVNETIYRFVSDDWLTSISFINDNWFNKAVKLNKARNEAAHAFDEGDIFMPFGINGNNKIEKLRSECLSLLLTVAGLINKEKD